MKIEAKITIFCAGSLLLTAVVFVATAIWQGQRFGNQAQVEVSNLVDADMNHITSAAFVLVKSQDEALRSRVDRALVVAGDQFRSTGNVGVGGSAVSWNAVNQLTRQSRPLWLPRLTVGNLWLGANSSMSRETPLVDKISRLTGATVTIFQRMNAAGDILRVATNVQSHPGRRAIGTYIPAVNPDGSSNPIITKVLRGETYFGNAFVVNAWYVSAYLPIKNVLGEVVGVLFVGYQQQSLPTLRQAILGTRVGQTGSLSVLGVAGSIQGKYLISNDNRRGEDAWNEKDTDGRFLTRELVRKALTLHPGEIASARFRVFKPGAAPEWKVYRLALYAPWNWALVTCADEKEFLVFNRRLNASQNHMIHLFVVEALAMVCACGLFSLWTKMVAHRLTLLGVAQQQTAELQLNNVNLEQIIAARTSQMEHQAFHDALTNLPNRALFRNRLDFGLAKRQRQAAPLAVVFIDLDNFKFINDSMGHDVGDQLLIEIAARLQACLQPGDTVARLGGDEFIILLENLNCVEDALAMGEDIVASWRRPLALQGKEHFATGSIGIAYCEDGSSTSEELMRDADTAMYHAKNQGKANYVLFHPDMNQHVQEKMEIEMGLRVAVERDELRVYYQPLIDLRTGRLIGAEALMRWQHPTLGMLGPGQFIGVAESTGLIVPIGYWILDQACKQAREWREQFHAHDDFIINVNLSGKQLQRDDIVKRVQEILQNTGLPPANLKLEITESVMMEDVEGVVAKLHQLKKIGVMLALDDFGTGYSSMASLSSFPIDTVKIDKSFVQQMSDDGDTSSVIAAMISLSKALRMDVTGEGIETKDHVSQLQGLGCDIGQGFYFAKPLTAAQMQESVEAVETRFALPLEERNLERIEALLRAA